MADTQERHQDEFEIDVASEEFRALVTPELMADWALRRPFPARQSTVPVMICPALHDLKTVFLDPERFTVETPAAQGHEVFEQFGGLENILQVDGLRHSRIRGLINPAFAPKAINALQAAIVTHVDDKLDRIAAGSGDFEIMAHFSADLVREVMLGAMLGFSEKQQRAFERMHRAMGMIVDFRPGEPFPDEFLKSIDALRETIDELVASRRGQTATDFISILVNTEIDGDRLNDDELFGNIVALCTGALGTTAGAIGMGMWLLCSHPDQFDLLKENLEENLPGAIDECLRYYPAGVFSFHRIATRDTEVSGVAIKKHTPVLLSNMAANFDPVEFPDPLRFDIFRQIGRLNTFGAGIHHCIGNRLARMVLRIALSRLITRFPNVGLAEAGFKPRFVGMAGELYPQAIPMSVN
jgi:cytochrome P450